MLVVMFVCTNPSDHASVQGDGPESATWTSALSPEQMVALPVTVAVTVLTEMTRLQLVTPAALFVKVRFNVKLPADVALTATFEPLLDPDNVPFPEMDHL